MCEHIGDVLRHILIDVGNYVESEPWVVLLWFGVVWLKPQT